MVSRSNAVLAAAAAAILVVGSQAVWNPAGATPQSAAATAAKTSSKPEKVIVVLRDQLASTPVSRTGMSARTSRATSSQDAVLGRLAGQAPSHVTHFAVGNAFSATVTEAQANALKADPAVASVVKDAAISARPARTTTKATTRSPQASSRGKAAAVPSDGPYAVCPSDPAKPLLEPEALQSIHALTTDGSPNAQQLSTGAGVKVAYIADGIDPDNPDFIRPGGQHVIVDYKDFSGDGPNAPTGGAEAFGDASSIAAQGTVSHDLSKFVNEAHPLPSGCNIRIVGVAPGASIVALKAGGEFLTNSSILQSIDYAVRVDHVDVINESFGLNQFPDQSNRNTISLFNQQAYAAGVTVTVSTGDAGVTGTIGSDATDPYVISAGATTDNRLYEQTAYAAAPFSNGKWVSDNISALSSGGISNYGRTMNLVAPGEGNWAVCEPGFLNCVNFKNTPQPTDVQSFGGTSESAPLTAGVAALVISAYRSTHGGASPTPTRVKQFITGTSTDLGLPAYEQGAGLLNARGAVEAALTDPTTKTTPPASAKSNIITSVGQIRLTGTPGSTQSGSFDVRNIGTKPLSVAAGSRGFSGVTTDRRTVAFDSTTLPQFTYYNGQHWAYKKVKFDVTSNTQRLLARMAWAGSGNGAADKIIRMTLLGPDGTLEANSRPQGGAATANYANVDVRNPVPGTWTAILYSLGGSGGYTGKVQLGFDTQRAVPFGSVSPAVFTLAPNALQKVTFTYTLPTASSGDQDFSITLGTSNGRTTSIPAIVRTLIDTASGSGHFSGVLTGGNARAVSPAQTNGYGFDVASGRTDLDVSLKFANAPSSIVDLVLLDPHGELADVVSNITFDNTGRGTVGSAIQSFTSHPLAGRWTMVVVAQNPVSGSALQQRFTGTVTFNKVGAAAPKLPTSSSTTLAKGQPVKVNVSVTNPGAQPILVGVDPRTNTLTDLQPVPIGGSTSFDLPPNPANEPVYSIPPNTTSLTVAANSTTPAQLELQGSAAGFDLFGDLAAAQGGNTLSVASVSESGADAYISKGIWFTNMQEIGPFTDAGAPAGHTNVTATMHTLGFDSAVTSRTDDPFRAAVDPSSDGFGTPVQINPGQTRIIGVTITPNAPSGSVVSGRLNIVTVPNLPTAVNSLPFYTTGEVISTLPYTYKVG